jgi:glycosyltransferase involved in cell wall biosynthesis
MTAVTSSNIAAPSFSGRNEGVDSNIDELRVHLSVVVPCFDERLAVEETLRKLERALASVEHKEIIVVDDASTDGTSQILDKLAAEVQSLRVIRHTSNRGYGGALKTGIRSAKGRFVAITDADGSYPNDQLPELLARAEAGADMVVGARIGQNVVYSKLRAIPKMFMRRYCVWITRQPIPDLNSGLRVFKREVIERFLGYLPDTFSFTTTATIAFMTNQYLVEYVPISYAARIGRSKISPVTDTIRFVQLIVRTALYFAPLRVLGPVIVLLWTVFFVVAGYDVFIARDLTQKDLLLLTFATYVTILGLLADMIDKRLK